MQIPNLTFFDVGARNGLSELHRLSKHLSLYSFEPGNPGANPSTKYLDHKIIRKGFYHSSGEFDFYLMRNPSMNSMLKPDQQILNEYFDAIPDFQKWRKQLDVISQTKIDATTIDAVIEEENLNTIDYLKLDTQGTELNILKGAEAALRQNKILVIKTEFAFISLYQSQSTFTDIDLFLKSHGYKLITCEFQYGSTSPFSKGEKPKWGIGGDAFYCIDDDKNSDREMLYRTAIVLGNLGFQSNAAHLFRKLNIDEAIYRTLILHKGKAGKKSILKYLLPPFVVDLGRKLLAISWRKS